MIYGIYYYSGIKNLFDFIVICGIFYVFNIVYLFCKCGFCYSVNWFFGRIFFVLEFVLFCLCFY